MSSPSAMPPSTGTQGGERGSLPQAKFRAYAQPSTAPTPSAWKAQLSQCPQRESRRVARSIPRSSGNFRFHASGFEQARHGFRCPACERIVCESCFYEHACGTRLCSGCLRQEDVYMVEASRYIGGRSYDIIYRQSSPYYADCNTCSIQYRPWVRVGAILRNGKPRYR